MNFVTLVTCIILHTQSVHALFFFIDQNRISYPPYLLYSCFFNGLFHRGEKNSKHDTQLGYSTPTECWCWTHLMFLTLKIDENVQILDMGMLEHLV